MSTHNAEVVFFKGRGLVPVLVRAVTWRWREGQAWGSVPAHCAFIVWPVEYEAIITGIRKSEGWQLSGVVGRVGVSVPRLDDTIEWLDMQVGKPYGFLACALTGAGHLLPANARRLSRLWERMAGGKSGRTAPLNCSLLCQFALLCGGLPVRGREDGLPVSPNDLLRILSK